ncbi:MAG: tape measure protein [Prevotellaceae bacterium]|jgi:hypothetical protein|nr:tape measure protein [Prevotellaceae bacterium]
MAGLGLKIDVQRLERLVQLREEIERLRDALRNMNGASSPGNFDALNRRFQQLYREAERLTEQLQRQADALRDAGEEASGAVTDFDKLQELLAKLGGATLLANLVKQMIDIRGQFQQLEIAFTTMLKSEEKAVKLMQDLTKFAAETPFGLQSAASGAKQLLAYRSTAETVIDELRMMGDVAAGTGQQLGDLVYLYGTLRTQGKAYLMDIRQFAGRGIPIYDELAKVLNTTEDKVHEFVSAGKVGFKEIEQAFKNMTSEAGLYGGLMEEQSKSITGRIEQLKDNIDSLFNEIGKKSEGVIYKSIDAASELVKNYEAVGKILLELVVAYGAYKAAIITITALERAHSAEVLRLALVEQARAASLGINMTLQQAQNVVIASGTAQVKLHTLAQMSLAKALNAVKLALATNPYALATAAVIALGYGIYKAATHMTDAEKAQKRLSDAVSESNASADKEITTLARLKGQLEGAEKGSDAYKEAKNKIVQQYGKYHEGLEKELESVGLTTEAYDNLTKAIQASWGARQYDEFKKAEQESLDNILSDNLGKIQKRLINKLGDTRGSEIYAKIRNAILTGGDLSVKRFRIASGLEKEVLDELDKVAGKDGGLFDVQNREIEKYINKILEAQRIKDELDIEAKKKFGIGELLNPDDGGKGDGAVTIFSNIKTEIEDTTRKVDNLKQELSDLRSGKTQSEDYVTDITSKTEELEEAQKKLDTLLGTDKKQDKVSGARLKSEKNLRSELLEMMRKSQDDRIALMEEGDEKELREIENKYDKEIGTIKEKVAEWKKAQNGKLTDEQTKVADEAWQTAFDKRLKAEADFYKEKDKEEKEKYNEYLKEYGNYQERLLAITNLYSQKISDAKTQGEKNILEAERKNELSKEANMMMKKTSLWKRFFNDIEKQSKSSVKNIISQMEILLSYADGTVQELPPALEAVFRSLNDGSEESGKSIDELRRALEEAKKELKELEKRNPFKRIANGFEDLSEATEGTEKYVKALNDIISGFGEVGSIFGQLGRAMEDAGLKAGELVGSLGEAMSNIASMASSGAAIGGGIGAVIGGVIGAGLTVLSSIQKQNTEITEAAKKSEALYWDTVNRRIEYQIELLRELKGLNVKDTEDSIKNAREELISSIKEYDLEFGVGNFGQFLNDITGGIMKAAERGDEFTQKLLESLFERTKNKDIFNGPVGFKITDILSGLTEEEIVSLQYIPEVWRVLPEDIREYILQLSDAVDLQKVFEETLEEIREESKELATGISFDSLKDSLDGLVTQADLTFESISDSFEGHMEKAILGMVKRKYLTEKLAEWYEQFAEAMDDDILSEKEAEKLRERYTQIASAGNEMFRNTMDAAGIDMTDSSTSDNSLRGAYAKASQESIDLLAGQTGAQRVAVEKILSVLETRLTPDKEFINQAMGNLFRIHEIQAAALIELRGIRELNARISESNDRISDLSEKISDNTRRSADALGNMEQNGLKVNIPRI